MCIRCKGRPATSRNTEASRAFPDMCSVCRGNFRRGYDGPITSANLGIKRIRQELRPGEYWCMGHEDWLPESNFGVRSDGSRYSRCKPCQTLVQRAAHLKRTYGMTLERYRAMLASQDGKCAICPALPREDRALDVDHDHSCCPGSTSCGKCVRGLLCERCNVLLGRAADSANLLMGCATYLTGHDVVTEKDSTIHALRVELATALYQMRENAQQLDNG